MACIAVNGSGTMVATASAQGTLVRVWDSLRRHLLVELRRGADPATLYWYYLKLYMYLISSHCNSF